MYNVEKTKDKTINKLIKIDLNIIKKLKKEISIEDSKGDKNFENIINYFKKLNLKDTICLLQNLNDQVLQNYIDIVLENTYKNKVYIRGLIEFSNICVNDCLYCGIRRSNNNVKRYILEYDKIINLIVKEFSKGIKTFVLQSGEMEESFIKEFILKVIKEARKKIKDDFAITLSCGVYSKNTYKEWKKAGVDRYLLRFETSDPKLYKFLCPGKSLKKRLNALYDLKNLGYEVGSGFMVGLPFEDDQTRAKNLLLCRDFDFDMVGIGPYIPHIDTPLYNESFKYYNGEDIKSLNQKKVYLTKRLTSFLRLMLPYSNVPATTASGTINPQGREIMLKAGANVLMPNITEKNYKKYYLLYPDKICIDEDGFNCVNCLSKRLENIGKEISFERGDSIEKIRNMKN